MGETSPCRDAFSARTLVSRLLETIQGGGGIIQAAPEFKVLARNPLEGRVQASMAAANGRLYIVSGSRIVAFANAKSAP